MHIMDERISRYIKEHEDQIFLELSKIISYKTVAMDENSKEEFINCVEYIKSLLLQCSFDNIHFVNDFGNSIIIAEKNINKQRRNYREILSA